ncbi:hypothetical protein [Fulvivirga sedimenti]|uniref:Uncharacterized protein n=1 Tax=Fulvivirga sedimenti TaxID=2879465 RepID=A0A9X1HRY2_9BACT|nr:hypothetical protein [Fulvivirga sedimenti]MCA6074510.1 hypothetical protein [Fulvivirga sedimenti]MCA6075687.1 hypothetical protein [Fulvivirga sedimenti]MCA6076815.1 hypothetical protein [Fulvivirga sedimenti]
MAYASAVTMCGGSDMYFTENNWVSYIPIVLGIAIVAMLFMNFKGRQTWAAFIVAFTGFVLITLTHQLIIPSEYYTAGSILFILAIWINGSFSSFTATVKGFFQKTFASWQQ